MGPAVLGWVGTAVEESVGLAVVGAGVGSVASGVETSVGP